MKEKNPGLKTCAKGHQFHKTSECPVCPVCEKEGKVQDGFLSLLSSPARRALENISVYSPEELAMYSEAEILGLHGIGKSSLPVLRRMLDEKDLAFRKPVESGLNPPETVDDYIAGFPPRTAAVLQQLRNTIRQAAPDAEEIISYKMPAYRQKGILVYFAAFTSHIGFFPTSSGIRHFKKQLSGYKGGKGSVRIPIDEDIPFDLIRDIVRFRLAEILDKQAMKRKS